MLASASRGGELLGYLAFVRKFTRGRRHGSARPPIRSRTLHHPGRPTAQVSSPAISGPGFYQRAEDYVEMVRVYQFSLQDDAGAPSIGVVQVAPGERQHNMREL